MGIFGESKDERLEKFSSLTQGNLLNPGGFKPKKVVIPHDNHQIHVYYYSVMVGNVPVTYTHFSTVISAYKPFQFRVVKDGFFLKIAKKLGHQDIEIGDENFDQMFVIESDDEQLPRKILTPKVKQTLIKHPSATLELKKSQGAFEAKLPENQKALIFQVPSEIKDLDALLDITEMFKSLLDALIESDYIR